MSFGLPPFGGIGVSLQILDIQQYASGLKLGPAAILNQNPIFEMDSRIIKKAETGQSGEIEPKARHKSPYKKRME